MCKVILLDRVFVMSLEENVEFGRLLDIYGDFLSQRQYDIISNYVNNDMSLGEIAENYNISRSAVLDALNTAKHKLEEFESKLKLYKLKLLLESASKMDSDECKLQVKKILEEF